MRNKIAWNQLCSGKHRPLLPHLPNEFPAEFFDYLEPDEINVVEKVWKQYPQIAQGGINKAPDWCLLHQYCKARGVAI